MIGTICFLVGVLFGLIIGMLRMDAYYKQNYTIKEKKKE